MKACGGAWTVEKLAGINVLCEVRGVLCYRFRCAKCGRWKNQPHGSSAEKAFAKPCRGRTAEIEAA